MANWTVQKAKSHFVELLDEAECSGPQIIACDGVEKAVVLSVADYRALTEKKLDFKDYLFAGPLVDSFEMPRSRDTGRKIRL